MPSQLFKSRPGYPYWRSDTVSPRARELSAIRGPLLPAHLLAPALGAALAVKERQSGVDHLRGEAHFIVREIRQDCQAIQRHVLALPAGVLQAAAEQMVELHRVLRADHVAVAVDEYH